MSCCWIRAILHERNGDLSQSIGSVRSHSNVHKVKVLLKVEQLIDRAAYKPQWPCPLLVAPENLPIGFYFAGVIFVVCQSTMKTAIIGPLENFLLYGS